MTNLGSHRSQALPITPQQIVTLCMYFLQALKIIPDKLEFLCGSPVELLAMQQTFPHVTFLCIDDRLVRRSLAGTFRILA